MKLELKHLAPYLPYGLKCKFESEDFNHLIVGVEDTIDGVSLISPFNDYGKTDISAVKPILRPLSDLTKEIEHKGEKFFPYEKLHLELSSVNNFLNEDLWIGQWWDYERVAKLLEWHFDVFGLIENGLAIDINILNKIE